ncbi:lycopene cyclase domain-containing protein [Xanthovirga aplysinae]|uniref:lycopene cyclase domain-containing protein n=1 Tax=Xanthovirga aplysinae TaxID=2529853 RepID=UPI0012BCB131|nr:lycopene cyclase domain-containing protein [Xanthovirga aplysinae]MTI33493.1 lycopene cyclase domain-containing protein [Xanthovirga aplysinae]
MNLTFTSFTYLLINLGSISLPLIFSFHPKIRFHKTWHAFWPACFLTGAFFITWDAFFTEMGVWGFNENYLTGLYLLNLPLEEWMFFICIPYACVFTYHNFKIFLPRNFFQRESPLISYIIAFILLFCVLITQVKWYTHFTLILTTSLLLYHATVLKKSYMGYFFISFAVLLIPFFITNGILTGSWINEEVVWYNSQENMGIRLGTIPIEDSIYALLLLLLNITLYEKILAYTKMQKS